MTKPKYATLGNLFGVPYNPKAVCSKCGCKKVRTHYCARSRPGDELWPYHDGHDYFWRTCENCGYDWPEDCKETEEYKA